MAYKKYKKTLGQFAFEADRRNADSEWDDADIYTRRAYSIVAEQIAKVSISRFKDKLLREMFPSGEIHDALLNSIIPKSSRGRYDKEEGEDSSEKTEGDLS